MNDLITILQLIIVSASTLIGVCITNYYNTKLSTKQLNHDFHVKTTIVFREKIEELYILTDNWLVNLFLYHMSCKDLLEGKIDYNEYLNSNKNYSKVNVNKLEMIINLYFPEVSTEFDDFIKSKEFVNKIIFKYTKDDDYILGNISSENLLQDFLNAEGKMHDAGEILKNRIVECAKNYKSLSIFKNNQ